MEVTALRGCSAVERELDIDLGRSAFRLNVGGDVATKAVDLVFLLNPAPRYVGQCGRLSIRCNDTAVGESQIAAYGPTKVRCRVRDVKTAMNITLNTRFGNEDDPQTGAIAEFSFNCARLSGFELEPIEDELVGRDVLIRGAAAMANELGLVGDYLSGEKAATLTARIVAAIKEGRGFSIVRVGDGEGRLLAFPRFFSEQEAVTQSLYYHFGPDSMAWMKANHGDAWVSASMQALRDLLVNSLRNADVVGLPVSEFYQSQKDRFGQLGFACGMMLSLPLLSPAALSCIVGTNVFRIAARQRIVLREVLEASPTLHIVGPWDLRSEMGEALGRKDIKFIEVPGHYTFRGSGGLGQFPKLYKLVEGQLCGRGRLDGQTFLVGAGLLGKHYCNLIKLHGGVAIDVGAVFDAWAKKGRPAAVINEHIKLDRL